MSLLTSTAHTKRGHCYVRFDPRMFGQSIKFDYMKKMRLLYKIFVIVSYSLFWRVTKGTYIPISLQISP